jgi:phosphate-selective porin OprO/OprP
MWIGRRETALLLAATMAFLCPATGGAQEGSASGEDGWRVGPGLRLSKKSSGLKLQLHGYVQGDLRSRRNFNEGDDEEEGLNGTVTELRRARIGLEGEWHDFSFDVTLDPADEGEHLKDLYGEYKFARAFRLRGGHFKVPFSQEFLTSAAKIDFIERSLVVTNLAPSRDWGGMAFGSVTRHLDYMVGVFKGDGRSARFRSERTLAARLEYALGKRVDLGASFTDGEVKAEAEVEGIDPLPRGLPGVGPSDFRFSETRFVSGNRRRFGADARFAAGPVGVRGEWLRAREERKGQGAVFDDLPAEIGQGWTLSATWLVTGEKKTRTIEPRKPITRGGIGAIEVGARYESMRFDDDGEDTGFAGAGNRARNIRPAADRAFTGGLSWWPHATVRLMGNVVLERYEDALLAPEPGRQGQYVTILGRLQVSLP